MSKHPNTEKFPKDLSQPAIRALSGVGFTKIEDLAGASEAELLKLHGLARKAIPVIREALNQQGLAPLRP